MTEMALDASIDLHGPHAPAIAAAIADVPFRGLADHLPIGRVIFEAPTKAQQTWLVRRLGPDVGLGNVNPDEALALETLRLGLRADTADLLPAMAGAPSTDKSSVSVSS